MNINRFAVIAGLCCRSCRNFSQSSAKRRQPQQPAAVSWFVKSHSAPTIALLHPVAMKHFDSCLMFQGLTLFFAVFMGSWSPQSIELTSENSTSSPATVIIASSDDAGFTVQSSAFSQIAAASDISGKVAGGDAYSTPSSEFFLNFLFSTSRFSHFNLLQSCFDY